VLDHVHIENNVSNGLFVSGGLQSINVTASDCVIANNGADGILARFPLANVAVRRCNISNNSVTGLESPDAGLQIAQSILTGNGNPWLAGGGVSGAGDNLIVNNSSNNAGPPIFPYK
jgi:hypothetical protein